MRESKMDNARILIIGAGVNGSICAASLFSHGVDVSVLARGMRLTELQETGIVIENPMNGKRTVAKVPVVDHLAPDDLYDFVLVVVRKNHAAALLPVLAQNHSQNIVFMGNNLTGPAEFVETLGRERVMMGSVYGAGKREGSIIRAMEFHSVAAPFGEIDGSISPRLKRLAEILRQGGFKVELSKNIVDTQATHAAGVALIGKLVLKHANDLHALANSTPDLKLFIQGRRETHQVLRALGIQVIPPTEGLITSLPAFLQVPGLKILLRSKFGEVGLAYHVSQAPDEMLQLAHELQEMVDRAGLPVPAVRKILAE